MGAPLLLGRLQTAEIVALLTAESASELTRSGGALLVALVIAPGQGQDHGQEVG